VTRRNPVDQEGHLENSVLHDVSALIYEYLQVQSQAALRSTSMEMFRRFNTAVFHQADLPCVGSRTGTIDVDDRNQVWAPVGCKILSKESDDLGPSIVIVHLTLHFSRFGPRTPNHFLYSKQYLRRVVIRDFPPERQPGNQLNQSWNSGGTDSSTPFQLQEFGDHFISTCPSLIEVRFVNCGCVRRINHNFMWWLPNLVTVSFDGLYNVASIGSHFLESSMSASAQELHLCGMYSLRHVGKCWMRSIGARHLVVRDMPRLVSIEDHFVAYSYNLQTITFVGLFDGSINRATNAPRKCNPKSLSTSKCLMINDEKWAEECMGLHRISLAVPAEAQESDPRQREHQSQLTLFSFGGDGFDDPEAKESNTDSTEPFERKSDRDGISPLKSACHSTSMRSLWGKRGSLASVIEVEEVAHVEMSPSSRGKGLQLAEFLRQDWFYSH
jgi:hypothetical protein